jgi:hypothetical protein
MAMHRSLCFINMHSPLLLPVLLLILLTSVASLQHPSKPVRKQSTIRSVSPRLIPSRLALSASSDNEAQSLKEKAEQLRREISVIEQSKVEREREQQRQVEEARQEQQSLRERYSAVLPILKPDGNTVTEQVRFPPYHPEGTSYILTCEAPLPLGLVLGESEQFAGAIVVDEVASDSHGASAGIQCGDIVRAFTACRMQMEQPAWQLMAGGIGRPKMYRYIHAVGVDRRVSFDMHLEALGSNRLDPEQRPVLLVLERKES